MLHKVFEGCDHLWTRIHNCCCAASLSIHPTGSQTSEDGGDAEWYLAAARRELCNYDFISCRWWAECIYELKNTSSDSSSIYLAQERLLRNVIRHELKWTRWRQWVGWAAVAGFRCLDNLPLSLVLQSVSTGLVIWLKHGRSVWIINVTENKPSRSLSSKWKRNQWSTRKKINKRCLMEFFMLFNAMDSLATFQKY